MTDYPGCQEQWFTEPDSDEQTEYEFTEEDCRPFTRTRFKNRSECTHYHDGIENYRRNMCDPFKFPRHCYRMPYDMFGTSASENMKLLDRYANFYKQKCSAFDSLPMPTFDRSIHCNKLDAKQLMPKTYDEKYMEPYSNWLNAWREDDNCTDLNFVAKPIPAYTRNPRRTSTIGSDRKSGFGFKQPAIPRYVPRRSTIHQ